MAVPRHVTDQLCSVIAPHVMHHLNIRTVLEWQLTVRSVVQCGMLQFSAMRSRLERQRRVRLYYSRVRPSECCTPCYE